MSTTENNKIIAEFLGRTGKANKLLYAFKNLDYRGQIWFNENELRFHLDWNWLMEVVEKIEKQGFIFDIKNYTTKITTGWKIGFKPIKTDSDTKIQSVYNACLEFIKWYNQQNK